jgi:hypothetical protein
MTIAVVRALVPENSQNAQLDRVVLELQELRARVERLEAAQCRSLTRDDTALLRRLLPVLAATFGSDVLFTTKEIKRSDHAGLQLVTRDVSARRLGKLLARACGQAIAGYTVARVGEESHRVLWRVLGAL